MDDQDAEYISELPLIAAGWDEAVAEVNRKQAQKNAPKPGGQRLYGGGMNA